MVEAAWRRVYHRRLVSNTGTCPCVFCKRTVMLVRGLTRSIARRLPASGPVRRVHGGRTSGAEPFRRTPALDLAAARLRLTPSGRPPAAQRRPCLWLQGGGQWGMVGRNGRGPVLLGEFVQKLDAKNRVTLPAKFRPHFADGVVVTKGLDGCLFVFNRHGWDGSSRRPAGAARPVQPRRPVGDPLHLRRRQRERARRAGTRDAAPVAAASTRASRRRSSWPASATTSRSGITRRGGGRKPSPRGAWRMLPNVSHSSSRSHGACASPRNGGRGAARPASGGHRGRLHVRRRWPCLPARAAAAWAGQLHRHRSRSRGARPLRRLRRRSLRRDAVHPRQLRAGAAQPGRHRHPRRRHR